MLGLFFVLGVIVGLLIAALVIATVIFFKKSVEVHVSRAVRQIEQAGPRPRGFVFEPENEAEERRQEIIAENQKAGRDTKVSDLI